MVSIGSLYQYFPSKDALLSALVDHFLAEMGALVAGAVEADGPFESTMRNVIGALISAKAENIELNRVLIDQLPRVDGANRLQTFNRRIEPVVAAFLRRFSSEFVARELDTASFVLVHAIQGVVTEAMRSQRSLDDRLADELTALTVGYLRTGPPDDDEERRRPRAAGAD